MKGKEMNPQAKLLKKWDLHPAAALLLVAAVAFVVGCRQNGTTTADLPTQTTFASPQDAGQALQAAAKAGDDSAIENILGPRSKAILNSGDAAEDHAAVAAFAAKYQRMNRWAAMTDGSQILYIGADNYPFPIPLAKDSSSKWYFYTKGGEEEIIARRIGKNELLAIDAVSAIGNAEELYRKQAHDGNPAHLYTQTILSTPGKQDGLHWDVPEDQPPSPLGRLGDFAKVAASSATSDGSPVFDGYAFRILTAQGDAAKGGAKSYIVNGRLSAGFAVLATPVKYQDSGIMTFILNREGVVYQKDLGPKTAEVAASIKNYNPTDEWTPAE